MLSDAQIDRYSRQIVLPEIGGRGQQTLLATRLRLIGRGPLLETAARYLAGAGVGALQLDAGQTALAAALRALNDDVAVDAGGDGGALAVVAADLTVDELAAHARPASAAGVPLIAAGRAGEGGWLLRGAGCAACAAYAAARRAGDGEAALTPVADGVLGSLAALAALTLALGRPASGAPLVWFDAADATLTAWQPPARPGCGCGGPPR